MAVDDVSGRTADRLRVAAWRGDEHIALVSPRPEHPSPSSAAVHRCLQRLAERGVREVITSALGAAEQTGFVAAGFTVRERLHLMSHDLSGLPEVQTTIRIRRARSGDRPAVLALDQRAFDRFWRLDAAGLDEALDATPVSRFRVAAEKSILGYAVFGRAADRGYVQRLAVDPDAQRRGIAVALLADGLRWLRRHGVQRAVVNTQEDNDSAVALYVRAGFKSEPEGLAVLTYRLSNQSQ